MDNYGKLIRAARKNHIPPMSAKDLAEALNVKAPFITDIEKGRRLPSINNQNKIKALLACDDYPEELFDDLAAADSSDPRVVALDLANALKKSTELCTLIRKINNAELSITDIIKITETITE